MLFFSVETYGNDEANVAWLDKNKVVIQSLNSQPSILHEDSKVPLGSLWKLFVYIYLVDTNAQEEEYVCSINPLPDDRYCCSAGLSVDRDTALAHSCAPYFDPNRVHISPKRWKNYWKEKTNSEWLADINSLKPQSEVSLKNLLHTLSNIPLSSRNEARNALLETGINLYGKEAWKALGSGIRYKTFSWHHRDGKLLGGAAGWLSDGTPFWFGATGSSYTTLTKWSQKLATTLPKPRLTTTTTDDSCVDVSFFANYPLSGVWERDSNKKVESGVLRGNFKLLFANGNWLSIHSNGDLRVTKNTNTSYTIQGRFGLNNYVARVLDREGNATQSEATKALAIAARTYLLQNGNYQGGCWNISDSSRTQRVSASNPTSKSLEAAYFTDDLILRGVPIHYHSSKVALNQLSWKDAYAQSASGWDFEKILKKSYPDASIATMEGRMECIPLKAAESWINDNAKKWESQLTNEVGYEPLESAPTVCRLSDGNPYSDQKRSRIYVRGWQSYNDRLTLAHEYLHLVFRYHPNGSNETYIENLARKLTGV